MAISKLNSNASLRQVMDKFEEISLMDFSSSFIDIITATSLPTTVKSGQIVVITNTTPTNITFDYKAPNTSVAGDLFIQIYAQDLNKFQIVSGNKKVILNIKSVSQYINGAYSTAEAYLGVNGSWIPLFTKDIYDTGNQCTNITGGWGVYVMTGVDIVPKVYDSSLLFTYRNKAINEQSRAYISTRSDINFSPYSTLNIEFESTVSPINSSKIYIDVLLDEESVGSFVPNYTTGRNLISINISSINNRGVFKLQAHKGGAFGTTGDVNIYKIWLE